MFAWLQHSDDQSAHVPDFECDAAGADPLAPGKGVEIWLGAVARPGAAWTLGERQPALRSTSVGADRRPMVRPAATGSRQAHAWRYIQLRGAVAESAGTQQS